MFESSDSGTWDAVMFELGPWEFHYRNPRKAKSIRYDSGAKHSTPCISGDSGVSVRVLRYDWWLVCTLS